MSDACSIHKIKKAVNGALLDGGSIMYTCGCMELVRYSTTCPRHNSSEAYRLKNGGIGYGCGCIDMGPVVRSATEQTVMDIKVPRAAPVVVPSIAPVVAKVPIQTVQMESIEDMGMCSFHNAKKIKNRFAFDGGSCFYTCGCMELATTHNTCPLHFKGIRNSYNDGGSIAYHCGCVDTAPSIRFWKKKVVS